MDAEKFPRTREGGEHKDSLGVHLFWEEQSLGETQLNLADNHCLHVCFKVSNFKLHFETVCVKYIRDEGAAWLVEFLLSMPDILSLIPSTA